MPSAGCMFNKIMEFSYTRGNDLSGTLEGAGGIGGMLARTAHTVVSGTILTHAFYADGAVYFLF